MNAPAEIQEVAEVTNELSEGFGCGPFTGDLAEMIALGVMPCPGCGLFTHAVRKRAA